MSKRSFLLLLWGSILFLAAELLFAVPVDQDPDLVLRVQHALQSQGYDPGPADGVVGPQTKEALRRFQRDQELKVTGIPDEPTLDRLRLDGDGPPGEDDDRIEAELRQKWEQNSRINPDNLEVDSRDGVVHLTFKGDDPTEFTLAVREARTVQGVKKIVVRYKG